MWARVAYCMLATARFITLITIGRLTDVAFSSFKAFLSYVQRRFFADSESCSIRERVCSLKTHDSIK